RRPGARRALNEGRDSRPGNGDNADDTTSRAAHGALNEGRDSRPGNGRRLVEAYKDATDPLNEGRDSRPGNGIDGASITAAGVERAQRGPGLASRQRARRGCGFPRVGEPRSTRAGTRVPATAAPTTPGSSPARSDEHTSELQSRENLVCR